VIDTKNVTLPLTVDPLGRDIQQQLLAKQFPPGAAWRDDHFGRALSAFDRTAIAGTPGDPDKGLDAGAAHVFLRVPTVEASVGTRWEPQQKLRASDGATGDSFGAAVAVAGDVALVGAPNDDDHGPDTGAVYVFVRSGAVWTQRIRRRRLRRNAP